MPLASKTAKWNARFAGAMAVLSPACDASTTLWARPAIRSMSASLRLWQAARIASPSSNSRRR